MSNDRKQRVGQEKEPELKRPEEMIEDLEPSPEECADVAGGVTITKWADKSSNTLLQGTAPPPPPNPR